MKLDELEAMPGFLVRRCSQIAVALFLEETAGFDITPPQYVALALIVAVPGMDQTWLTARSGLDRSTVTGIIDRLAARAFIRREVDPNNRRARLLFPTQEGMEFLDQIQSSVARAQQRILAPLPPDERAQFLALLRRLVDANNEQSRVPLKSSETA